MFVCVYGCVCMGVCVWVCVHGCVCMGVCVWVCVYGCVCMGRWVGVIGERESNEEKNKESN